MNTTLDCLPCFLKLAIRSAREACPENESMHEKIVSAWGHEMADLDYSLSPPEITARLNELVQNMTGCGDLYELDKKESNEAMLEVLPSLKKIIERSSDPLFMAIEISIIGNFIDRGVEVDFDWRESLENLSETLDRSEFVHFDRLCTSGAKVLILGDNAGEIVLDTLIVKELVDRGCNVTFAVRGKPTLNDATIKDARDVGMTSLCTVVESGVDTPGNVLDRCSADFVERMKEADVILSKGQGNLEALSGNWDKDIYFAFKAKCPRIAQKAGKNVGDSVFGRF